MTVAPGTRLGPYDILAELGHGGMGVVYTARDPRLDRQVAIKVLPPDLTRDDAAKQRFLQEAKAASALDHPNICNIHEINEAPDGELYLVMAADDSELLMVFPIEQDDAPLAEVAVVLNWTQELLERVPLP
jgi:serine/threonine protein kinase